MSYSDAYDPDDGVAIIGLAGRFPGARNVDEFWSNLVDGRETLSLFADDELEPAAPDEMAARRQPNYVRSRGILDDVEMFDAEFFGINPKRGRGPRPAAARVPGDGVGGARGRGPRPAELRRRRSACSPGMSNNYYFLQNLLARAGRHRHRRLADHDDGQREGLPRDARGLQARPARARRSTSRRRARRRSSRCAPRSRACSTTSATWRSPAASRSRCRRSAGTCTRKAGSPRPTGIAGRSTSDAAGTVFSNGVGHRRAAAAERRARGRRHDLRRHQGRRR